MDLAILAPIGGMLALLFSGYLTTRILKQDRYNEKFLRENNSETKTIFGMKSRW